MADNLDEKPRSLVDANAGPTRPDPCKTAADLSSAEEGSPGEKDVASNDGTGVINLVNGLPRYLLTFGLMCALFCVSLASSGSRRPK